MPRWGRGDGLIDLYAEGVFYSRMARSDICWIGAIR
jgi:hypothetical protein